MKSLFEAAESDRLPHTTVQQPIGRYGHLSREEMIALLEARDGRAQDEKGLIRLNWDAGRAAGDRNLDDRFVTMRLDPDLSGGTVPWENLVIEGDNLQTLQWLRMTMRGRVKCIFVDPPYGVLGQNATYGDGKMDASDRFATTTWLDHLQRRFSIARDLLTEDGVILVTINDEHRATLELMLDQTLVGMKIGSVVWRTRAGTQGGGAYLSSDHEHVLIYANDGFAFGGTKADTTKYSNPDSDVRGPWVSVALQTNKNHLERPNSYQPVKNPRTGHWHPCNPNRVWSFMMRGQEGARGATFEDMHEADLLLFTKEGEFVTYGSREELDDAIRTGIAHPYLRKDLPDLDRWVGVPIALGSVRKKQFLSHLKTSTKPLSSWVRGTSEEDTDVNTVSIVSGMNQEGTSQLRKLMGADLFPYPKPVSLVRELVRQSTGPQDFVLDFFAGSGTTAQAVMELNDEDGLDRRFVMASLTEATSDDPDRNLVRDVLAARIDKLNALAEEDENKNPAPYAYLRADDIPTEALMDPPERGGPDPRDMWITIQLRHGLPIEPFRDDASLQISITDRSVVMFCDKTSRSSVDAAIFAVERWSGRAVHIYAWTPGPFRRAFEGTDLELHSLPSALWKRFKS